MDRADIIWSRRHTILAYNRAIGREIADLRARQNKDQRDVAKVFGCSQSDMSKIENGQRSLKAAELIMLAHALEVTPEELFSIILTALQQDATQIV